MSNSEVHLAKPITFARITPHLSPSKKKKKLESSLLFMQSPVWNSKLLLVCNFLRTYKQAGAVGNSSAAKIYYAQYFKSKYKASYLKQLLAKAIVFHPILKYWQNWNTQTTALSHKNFSIIQKLKKKMYS